MAILHDSSGNGKLAAIYARVSTEEQTKGYSLQTQLEACRQYAAQRGYIIPKGNEFTDDYTGVSLDRPGLNCLRELAASGAISAVIVYDIDRLARKSVYQLLLEEELGRAGVTVEYVVGQYEDTDEGRLQKQIRASIAEYEKAKILERSKRGKRGKAQSGFVIVGARPPYGYRVESQPHKAWLVIDEEEAQIVRLVYTWYIYGDEASGPLSMNAIAGRLTRLGIPTRGDKVACVAKKYGRGVWSAAMVRHILTNEAYTGTWYFGKTRMVDDGKGQVRKPGAKRGLGKQVPRPREEWIAVSVPAIIDRDTFQMAQQRIKLNAEQAKRNARREYLLGRRLRCAKCGQVYVGRTRRERNRYYYCKGSEMRPKICDMPAFRADQVDGIVWAWLKALLQRPEHLAEGLRGERAERERANSALRDRLQLIESQLAGAQEQLARLLDLYLSGGFPKEMLTERRAQLERLVADLERERGELQTHLQAQVWREEQIAEIQRFCEEVAEGLEYATFDDKRRYFDLLDVRATLACEQGERIVYVSCKLGKQRLSVAVTSPLSSTGATPTTRCASRPTRRSP